MKKKTDTDNDGTPPNVKLLLYGPLYVVALLICAFLLMEKKKQINEIIARKCRRVWVLGFLFQVPNINVQEPEAQDVFVCSLCQTSGSWTADRTCGTAWPRWPGHKFMIRKVWDLFIGDFFTVSNTCVLFLAISTKQYWTVTQKSSYIPNLPNLHPDLTGPVFLSQRCYRFQGMALKPHLNLYHYII